MTKVLLSLLLSAIIFVLCSKESYGIPAFARKYKTSCATCHNGFPKLNGFGEAFRRNGYQFPGGTDAEVTKEEPVSLGSEGYKKAFPDAIWPGSIPGSSPISLFLNSEMDYNPTGTPRFTFGGLGSSIEAVTAGTLGSDISFWGHAILGSEGLELNRIFLIFSNLIGDSYALNARIGVFEPNLFSFSTHRAWAEGYWITTKPFSSDMGWSIEETQKGIELNGVAFGQLGYSAGVVESFGKAHSDKDIYGHVTYKIGGMPLDGVIAGGTAQNNSQPYMDNSCTIGAFIYKGMSTIGPDSLLQDNKFTMMGGDVNIFYDRFNLFGGIGIRNDDQPFVGTIGQSAKTTVAFAELDYVLYPWLLPGIRYESWNSHNIDGDTGKLVSYSDKQIVPCIMALIRPNLKATLRTSFTKYDSNKDTKYQFGQVMLLMSLGI